MCVTDEPLLAVVVVINAFLEQYNQHIQTVRPAVCPNNHLGVSRSVWVPDGYFRHIRIMWRPFPPPLHMNALTSPSYLRGHSLILSFYNISQPDPSRYELAMSHRYWLIKGYSHHIIFYVSNIRKHFFFYIYKNSSK